MSDENKLKRCCSCKKKKNIKEFHKDKSNKDGLYAKCIKCDKERKLKNWSNNLVMTARSHSKYKNNEFNINKEYILELFEKQKGLCYWFKIPMITSLNRNDPQQVTIDRLDQGKGYIKENVVLTCFAANMGRNITSVERFREFVELVQNRKATSN